MSSEPERIEQERVRKLAEAVGVLWSCPDCAFTFDACHENTDGTGYTCPLCENERLRAELGSYGPPETERRVENDAGIWECDDRDDAENWLKEIRRFGYNRNARVKSSSVRRGPWVTNEKPENSQDSSTLEASEGVGSDG